MFRWYGLRGTGILARAEQGYEVDQIANDIPERIAASFAGS
jgi:hypothetical protein